MTLSPCWRPPTTSTVFTEVRPSRTVVAHRLLAVGRQLEQAHRAPRLTEGRPPDVQHVVESLDLDGAVHREIRPGAARERAAERHVHGHGAVLHRGIDADDFASRDAVPGVDGGGLSDGDVLGLGLGNAQHRLEPPGLHDARQRGAALGPLPHLERELLQNALSAGHDHHRAHPTALELIHVPETVHLGLLQR